jgi:DNA repair photolyase
MVGIIPCESNIGEGDLMKVYEYYLNGGITRTTEFQRKGLCDYAGNTGLICGHGCSYCSTGAMVRTHEVFKKLGLSPFERGYAIVDPQTPTRLARDARRKRKRGLVQLCTIVDAWSPEAQQHNLGRKCLQAILSQPDWSVRILTKSVAVREDFDLVEKHKGRVLVGMSITAPPDKSDVISVIEPYASPIQERIAVMKEAVSRGFRVYAMFCPILPGIADAPEQIGELIRFAAEWQAEEIFAEAVNPRGRGLILTQQALKSAGFRYEAAHVESVRCKQNWSWYVVRLIKSIQHSVGKLYDISKLRFLLYPSRLEEQDLTRIKADDAGVIWLGKN